MHEIIIDKKQSEQNIKDVLYSFMSKRGHSHMQNLQFDATPLSILFLCYIKV